MGSSHHHHHHSSGLVPRGSHMMSISQMVFSKELRVPKEWSKYHFDIVKEPIDPELFSEDELFDWVEDLGLTDDKSVVTKYAQRTGGYLFLRLHMVFFPKNSLFKKLFKLWAHLVPSLFVTDDFLEATSEIEMRQVCDGFEFLAGQIRGQLPQFPTIAEMKQSLLLQKIDEKLIPHTIHLMDFANNVAKSIIQHSSIPIESVNEYWRRLVVVCSLYYAGVAFEVKHSVRSYSEDVWTGVFTVAYLLWLPCLEILSGAVGKTTEHLSLINELSFLATFSARVVNDIYSYNRELVLEHKPVSMVARIAESKEVTTADEALIKNVEILGAIVKVMYQRIEKAKQENQTNKELCKWLDNIGVGTIGVHFWHHYIPRYTSAPCRLSFVGVEEDELKEWRKCSEEEPPKELFPVLLDHSQIAKRINDAIISGVVPTQVKNVLCTD